MFLVVGEIPHLLFNGCLKAVLEIKAGMAVQAILILTKEKYTKAIAQRLGLKCNGILMRDRVEYVCKSLKSTARMEEASK